jgi:hypothetical protein
MQFSGLICFFSHTSQTLRDLVVLPLFLQHRRCHSDEPLTRRHIQPLNTSPPHQASHFCPPTATNRLNNSSLSGIAVI